MNHTTTQASIDTCNLLNYCDCVDDCANYFFHYNHSSEVDFVIFRSSFQKYYILPQVFFKSLEKSDTIFIYLSPSKCQTLKKETLFLYLFFGREVPSNYNNKMKFLTFKERGADSTLKGI